MSYQLDADAMSLDQLRKRLDGTDLIPSKFYKGKIGLRDIKRLIAAADLVG